VDRLNIRLDAGIDRIASSGKRNRCAYRGSLDEKLRHVAGESVHRNKTRQLQSQVYNSNGLLVLHREKKHVVKILFAFPMSVQTSRFARHDDARTNSGKHKIVAIKKL
jgi:hypothetical protein